VRFIRDAIIAIVVAAIVLFAVVYARVADGGLSADAQPGRLERQIAGRLVRLSIPSGDRAQKNPFAGDVSAEAVDHYNDHCAVCHGADGRGHTEMGENMYPKVPDLASPAVQQLSDGDLFFIIQNGVRWTGMPAWKHEHTPEDTWKLVAFVRRVPSLPISETEQKSHEHHPR
jgi:cytochrome c553